MKTGFNDRHSSNNAFEISYYLWCSFCFFFSSRRRHTRFDCDWSSDVCSSDLTKAQRMRRWTEVEKAYKDGRIIKGRVTDRIKGGLTVDVGLRAFLPGSLVEIGRASCRERV